MLKSIKYYVLAAIFLIVCLGIGLIFFYKPIVSTEDILAAYEKTMKYSELTITYPLDGTLFPPEIVSPIFRWKDDHSEVDSWLVALQFENEGKNPLSVITKTPEWRPSDDQWEVFKKLSLDKKAKLIIIGIKESSPDKILSANNVSISTSKDEVGDSIFYREVILPFSKAVMDASEIRWRFGAISSKSQPPIVLEDLPVCGNCHSFSADGKVLAMDIDFGNDKGSYVIAPVEEEMTLDASKIITWSDYERDNDEVTFGLLSRISPDGNYAISTVKDMSIDIDLDEMIFSRLFFPIKGILVFYNKKTGEFKKLPGADDPKFVQSNPVWSPDGKYIVFTRAKAYDVKRSKESAVGLIQGKEAKDFVEKIKSYKYDLCKIPFNNGKGGTPEPLEGASSNGMSNYFAKFSPNGKWIVFCKSANFMLLQPDSELFIVPAEGGKARKMRCNTNRMNSWHSWSSNSKWLIFSSKVNTPYTQLFLTHIDEKGNDTPPVLLEQFTSLDRAANLPEFVNQKSDAIKVIREQYLDDMSFMRAADVFITRSHYEDSMPSLKKALEINPENAAAHANLGIALTAIGNHEKAIEHYKKALLLEPDNANTHNNLGMSFVAKGMTENAIQYFTKALKLNPDFVDSHTNLGLILSDQGKMQEAIVHFREVIRLDPKNESAYFNMGTIMFKQGKYEKALGYFKQLIVLDSTSDAGYNNSALILYKMGRFKEADKQFRELLELNPYSAQAHNNLAVVLENLGKHQEAAFHREKAKMLSK